MRGIFFDEEHARTAARVLVSGGFAAEVIRERLSGEDDDEDHPWAVVTDAPPIQLEMLVETYDGWLDDEDPGTGPLTSGTMLPLPDAPKRVKKP
ncbi:hypothetical protein ACFQ0K_11115 [Nocardioides caeni]|uniref:Uncharacterized protein n=1 Tax=Nocardioides caeni TaxID=574700 RepID=A0A4S8NR75_9ACTN|nr:hypothetical protein [Nocardioides caeni]THV17989.1 hypothetical protein E9934_05955 [Nocardioides caeni]